MPEQPIPAPTEQPAPTPAAPTKDAPATVPQGDASKDGTRAVPSGSQPDPAGRNCWVPKTQRG